MQATSWHYQDTLKFSVDQWCKALRDPDVFDDNALAMIRFVYSQKDHTSTASDVAKALSDNERLLHTNTVTAWNTKVGKALYEKCNMIPPINTEGGYRYWNVVFDGNPKCEKDHNGHYFWILRPNLVKAMEKLELV